MRSTYLKGMAALFALSLSGVARADVLIGVAGPITGRARRSARNGPEASMPPPPTSSPQAALSARRS